MHKGDEMKCDPSVDRLYQKTKKGLFSAPPLNKKLKQELEEEGWEEVVIFKCRVKMVQIDEWKEMRKRKHYWELTDEQRERAKARVKRWRDVNRDTLTALFVDQYLSEREQGEIPSTRLHRGVLGGLPQNLDSWVRKHVRIKREE